MAGRIEIRGLDSLQRSLDNVAKELHKPFQEIHEDSRHKDIIRIQERQLKIQEEQNKILHEQGKLVNKQTEFSKMLMLATIVLAIGAFLQATIQIAQIPGETYAKLINAAGFWLSLLFFTGLIFWLALMGGIIYLIVLAFRKKR